MCWIFGYVGWPKSVHSILINGLQNLEYRWYDSAWIAMCGAHGEVEHIKSVGKVNALSKMVFEKLPIDKEFVAGIAHTRWATHGAVNHQNTHPHTDSTSSIFLVHNWIIENCDDIRDLLEKKWYTFYSQTDSEIVAKLVEDNWNGNLLESVEASLNYLQWAFAFLFMHKDFPDQIVAVKYWSPLVFGVGSDWSVYFSSDVNAFGPQITHVSHLEDGDIVYCYQWKYLIKSEWTLTNKPLENFDATTTDQDKWEYEHFMLKEIYEQPAVIERVIMWKLWETNNLHGAAFDFLDTMDVKHITFIACWTSYHAWILGSYWIQEICGITSNVEVASEFEYKKHTINPNTLYVFISQSWETADTLECLKLVKSKWWKTFGVVNVVGSSISRLTDCGMFTRAWSEIWVASTKAFMGQISSLYLLSLYLWKKTSLNKAQYEYMLREFTLLPQKITTILNKSQEIRNIAKQISHYKNFFFLWKYLQYPVAMESSLKLKEISYIHSEAYPSGELKHWPLALIDEYFPTILFMPNDLLIEKNKSSLKEIQARKWLVIAVSDEAIDSADIQITIPHTISEFYPFLTVVVGQLLSYYIALDLWKEIDKPRNLAKSVTVK